MCKNWKTYRHLKKKKVTYLQHHSSNVNDVVDV